MHNNRHMIVHILTDIAEKASSHNTDGAKPDASKIHILVTLRIRQLAGLDDDLEGRLVVADTGDQPEAVEQRHARQLDGLGDVGDVRDAELVDHAPM